MIPMLDDEDTARYRRDGVLFPLAALDPAEAAAGIPRLAALRRRMQGWTEGRQLLKSHLVAPWVCDLVCNELILDAVEALLGPDILCWGATFFDKPAGDTGFVGWHQDITYWGLAPDDSVLTVWLALTDARTDNGCMCVIPGSHLGAVRRHDLRSHGDNMLLSGQEAVLADGEDSRAVAVELEPGEFSIHHTRLLHGSRPNPSSRPRIGLAIQYMATPVRQTAAGGHDSAMLVRGRDDHGHFELEPRPAAAFDDRALAAYRRAIQTPSGVGSVAPGVPSLAHLDAIA